MIEVTPDLLMAIGSVIGISSKAYALKDSNTVWSRKSSLLNTVALPVTALYPMYELELWLTLIGSTASFLIWCGIYLFRSPEEEDLIGRTKK